MSAVNETMVPGITDDHVREYFDRRIDAGDVTVPAINHKGSRYFVPHAHRDYPEIETVTFGEKMAHVHRRHLGPDTPPAGGRQ